MAQFSNFPKGGWWRVQAPLPARTLWARWSVHSDPLLLPGYPRPTHSPEPQPPRDQPRPLRSRAPLPPLAPLRPPPPRAPLRRRGRVAEREEVLEEGGSGSGPTCISVPAVCSGGGGSSRSLPLPPHSATSSQAASAQARGPLFPSPKEATIEKSGEREGHLNTHFRHPPIPRKPFEA